MRDTVRRRQRGSPSSLGETQPLTTHSAGYDLSFLPVPACCLALLPNCQALLPLLKLASWLVAAGRVPRTQTEQLIVAY
ncbi:hypothetical protein QQF64_029728 [Cirrhinus molitorella]|uniref:Uncharacterized protein n=1 Tax=Cirrhinus molitorella TaxID=172907 RepID=A0ABR3N1F8_9TELE